MVSALPNPHATAISGALRALSSSRRRAGLDAHALNETARRHADLTDENPAEIPRAHRCAARQGVHRQICMGMIGNPHLKITQGLAVGDLRRELDTELCLASRPLEEEDLSLRYVERDAAANVLLHER